MISILSHYTSLIVIVMSYDSCIELDLKFQIEATYKDYYFIK